MLRHSEQWRFGVCWQDDSATGFSVSYGGAPPGQGGIGSDAVAGGTAGTPAAPGVAAHGPSGIGAPSGGGSTSYGGGSAATGGGAASGATTGAGGAATGGGGGTAAGGSASGPGGGGAPGASGGAVGGTSIGNIAPGFFSSIMGATPANAAEFGGGLSPDVVQQLNDDLQARGFFGGSVFGPSSAFGTPGTGTDLGVPPGVLTGGAPVTPVQVTSLPPGVPTIDLTNPFAIHSGADPGDPNAGSPGGPADPNTAPRGAPPGGPPAVAGSPPGSPGGAPPGTPPALQDPTNLYSLIMSLTGGQPSLASLAGERIPPQSVLGGGKLG